MPNRKGRVLVLLSLLVAVVLAVGWWNRAALLGLVSGESASGGGAQAGQGRPPTVVEVAPVQQREIEARLEATGTLKAPETVTVTARSPGRVDQVLFEEGRGVDRHEALVLLERERALAGVREAAARVTQTARQFARLDRLDAESFVSETEVEQARAAASEARAALQISNEELADRIIEAPFDGIVGRRQVSPGALLEPGTPVATLSRVTPLDLSLDVPGTAVARIQNGQTVTGTTPAYPDREFEGRVTFVAPEVSTDTRTLAFEATFDNDDHLLKPGMFMSAAVVTGRREVLTVPEAAVIAQGPSKHLFVVETSRPGPEEPDSKGSQSVDSKAQDSNRNETDQGSATQGPSMARARRQAVQTGIRRSGWVEITRGISAGERVVVAGLQSLRDGATVRIASKRSDARPPDQGPGQDQRRPGATGQRSDNSPGQRPEQRSAQRSPQPSQERQGPDAGQPDAADSAPTDPDTADESSVGRAPATGRHGEGS